MHDDDKDYNGFTHTFTWSADAEHMHPYTYNWVEKLAKDIFEADQQQAEVEWSETFIDLTDALISLMPSYPDAEDIIEQIRANIA